MLRRTFLRCLAALPLCGLVGRFRPAEAAPAEAAETVIGCDVTGDRQTLVRLEREPDGSWKIVGVVTLHRDPETGLFMEEAT